MDKNNSGETTTTKKSTIALLLIHCHFILHYSPAPISNRSFSKLQVNYYQIRIIQKRWFLKMLGNIPLEKKKKNAQQEVTGARWQEVVRSSQFKSADGTATPNQLQTVRVRPAPTTAADGESHIALLYLTSKGCPSEMASLWLDSFCLQRKKNYIHIFSKPIGFPYRNDLHHTICCCHRKNTTEFKLIKSAEIRGETYQG